MEGVLTGLPSGNERQTAANLQQTLPCMTLWHDGKRGLICNKVCLESRANMTGKSADFCNSMYLEGLASMVGKSADALCVEVACNFICLGLERAVHDDGGHILQGLLLQQLQNSPLGRPSC